MAFPTVTAVSDDFNRANESPLAGSWTGTDLFGGGTNVLSVSGNRCQAATATFCSQIWTPVVGPNLEIRITVPVVTATDTFEIVGLYARLANAGGSTATGYVLWTQVNAGGADGWTIYRLDTGQNFASLATGSQEVSGGDQIGFELIGSALKGYYSSNGTVWNNIVSATDATYSAAGKAGMETRGNNNALDNWIIGPIVTSTRDVLSGNSDNFVPAPDFLSGTKDMLTGTRDLL